MSADYEQPDTPSEVDDGSGGAGAERWNGSPSLNPNKAPPRKNRPCWLWTAAVAASLVLTLAVVAVATFRRGQHEAMMESMFGERPLGPYNFTGVCGLEPACLGELTNCTSKGSMCTCFCDGEMYWNFNDDWATDAERKLARTGQPSLSDTQGASAFNSSGRLLSAVREVDVIGLFRPLGSFKDFKLETTSQADTVPRGVGSYSHGLYLSSCQSVMSGDQGDRVYGHVCRGDGSARSNTRTGSRIVVLSENLQNFFYTRAYFQWYKTFRKDGGFEIVISLGDTDSAGYGLSISRSKLDCSVAIGYGSAATCTLASSELCELNFGRIYCREFRTGWGSAYFGYVTTKVSWLPA